MAIRWHDEAPDELREVIRFTAEETGFAPRMIEKDYFCSVVLEAIGEAGSTLVFTAALAWQRSTRVSSG